MRDNTKSDPALNFLPMPDGFSAFTVSKYKDHDGPMIGICMLKYGEIADDLIMMATPEYVRDLAEHLIAAADRCDASDFDLGPNVQ